MKLNGLGGRVWHGLLGTAARALGPFGLMKHEKDAFGSDETPVRFP